MEDHNLQLTEMEAHVLRFIIDNLYAEVGFSDIGDTCIAEGTGIPMNKLRGVISSLSKKGIVHPDPDAAYYMDWCSSIVYLNEKFYYLHPVWKDEE